MIFWNLNWWSFVEFEVFVGVLGAESSIVDFGEMVV